MRCRFAVSLIHSKPGRKAAETLRRLNRNARTAFDDLLMSENSRRPGRCSRGDRPRIDRLPLP